jgi:hypothetical protein
MTSFWTLFTSTRAKELRGKVRMKWFRLQAIFIALALVLATSECLVRCAAQPCHEGQATSEASHHYPLSPCPEHQHSKHPSKESKGGAHCANLPVLAQKPAAALTAAKVVPVAPVAFLPIREVSLLFSYVPKRVVRYETSPPRPPELVFSTVLLI